MDKGFKVLIPARYGSTRLPGKPLLEIAGKPMIQHVVERARASDADEVVVATDDRRILAACSEIGVTALLTDSAHRSGTDRVAEAMERCGWEDDTVIVNLQGDEPCMPSSLIRQVATELVVAKDAGIATLAHAITESAALFDPHVVKVVLNAAGQALYFSRAPIPWHRDEFLRDRAQLPDSVRFLRHIGLYAYRVSFLRRYVAFEPSPLEIAESLEQLRVLWHGEPIRVGVAEEEPGPGVDTAADLARAAAYLAGS
ncbi:3-deoxy-manno-octulosonate cytidylyltransferase [Thiorhodococcus minor]|uniref:3-deoxy-manno-octulosonate cytidylyltransferase n=1 Tax=Thiorhodococcus minor TaxID=57489 RepID=A0A6M0K569_9GAMM|nr:3-deoxy-manno-octulosonate cytidylyltransferase [Thiorhodococcus minor]NEV63505.1 3-deoxy-manno-octulosonate cytidylyltransferase [Thiorhodococcus minor]